MVDDLFCITNAFNMHKHVIFNNTRILHNRFYEINYLERPSNPGSLSDFEKLWFKVHIIERHSI